MKEDNNIEDLFRSSFDHFEAAPPAAVKEAIDRKLGASSKRGIWWISGLVVILGTASLLFFFNYSSGKQSAGSADRQLASNETPSNGSTSTAGSNNTSPTSRTSNSSGQSDEKNTTASGTADRANKQDHANGNQAVSSAKTRNAKRSNTRRTPSMTSSKSSKKNSSAKTSGSKQKGASGKKSSGKKSSGKKSNSGIPDINSLSVLPKLTVFDNTPVDIGGGDGNSPDHPDVTNNSITSDSDPPKKTDPVVNDPKADPIAEKADSTKEEETKKVLPEPKKNKGGNWLASVYAGPLFVNNSKSGDDFRALQEKPSFQFSAEINRSLFAGYGLTTGFGFNKRQETYKWTALQVQDSAIVVNDTIPIYGNPNFPDSITGYLDTTYYLADTTSIDFTQLNRIQTIGIPLYFTKHFSFNDKWGLLVNAGAVFQFHKVSLGESNDAPAPTVNDFSMNVTGRFHLTYTWNQWMFSAGVSTGWEMKQAIIYESLDRKRYFLTPQLGFRFRF